MSWSGHRICHKRVKVGSIVCSLEKLYHRFCFQKHIIIYTVQFSVKEANSAMGISHNVHWSIASSVFHNFTYSWVLTVLLFSCSVMSNSLQPHGLQHTRLPCPSPSPRACSNSCPLNQWCHPPSHPLSSPSPTTFNLSQHRVFSTHSALRIRWPKYWSFSSASVLLMNIQDWFPLWLTGLISTQSKGFSRVFSNTTVQKH